MFDSYNLDDYKLTEQNVFRRITPEAIFAFYLPGVEVGSLISSPFRRDDKPSFSIFYSRIHNTILYKDLSNGESGGPITFVRKKFMCTYIEALNIINTDFNLGLGDSKINTAFVKTSLKPDIISKQSLIKKKAEIIPAIIPFTEKGLEFWQSLNVSVSTLNKFNVSEISAFWLDGNKYNIKSIAFVYNFSNSLALKIYQPLNTSYKFMYNGDNAVVQGLSQLPAFGDLLVITKSLKDVLVLHDLGIAAIAPQTETSMLTENCMVDLLNRFSKVVTLFDYDNAGIHLAWQFRKEFNIQPFFLREKLWGRKQGYRKCKDISDYISLYGKSATLELIQQARDKR